MDKRKYLNVLLEDQDILFPIDSINMVLEMPALQVIPNDKKAFKGMLNFHGIALPVYDLLSLVYQEKAVLVQIDTPLLLAYAANHQIGLVISGVKELIEIDTDALQKPTQNAMPYVTYLYETEKKCAWVLDLDKLITHNFIQLSGEITNE